jgi:hypothetical protein
MDYSRTGWNVNHPNNITGIHPSCQPLGEAGVVILKETRHQRDGSVIKWTWHGMNYSTPNRNVNQFRIVDQDGRVFPGSLTQSASPGIMNPFESETGMDGGPV